MADPPYGQPDGRRDQHFHDRTWARLCSTSSRGQRTQATVRGRRHTRFRGSYRRYPSQDPDHNGPRWTSADNVEPPGETPSVDDN